MSYSLKYDPDTKCMILKFDKKVTMSLIKEAALLVASMSEETGSVRLLNDMSAATIDMSLMEIFNSPAVMNGSKVSRNVKRALVVPVDFKDAHFLETVTRNRGHNLMVFQDVESAKHWLFSENA